MCVRSSLVCYAMTERLTVGVLISQTENVLLILNDFSFWEKFFMVAALVFVCGVINV